MIKPLIWKFLERFGVFGAQFVLQIVLARILSPEHYGVLSIMIVFTTIANVFIQTGFSTSLIQNKDVTEDDYSSVYWVTLGIAAIFYLIIFISAPLISSFYRMPEIIWPLRVLALMLFPGALNSIQLAKASRDLDFRNVFFSNIGAILSSGIAGIIIALCGGGLWSLVVQNLLNVSVAAIVMTFTIKWHPRFVFDLNRVKVLFSFGWKLLLSSLIDTIYHNLQSLVVGKKYASDTLGYFNRGQQFPQAVISVVNGTVQSVMLPVMSSLQDDVPHMKQAARKSIRLGSYLLFPMMAGLIATANPLIKVLLTDEWLPAVPYLRIFCLSFALYPIHTCNLQAINALGRSDIFLKLEIIKKTYGIISIFIAVLCFDSPIAIAFTGVVTTLLSSFVNAFPNKKLLGYSWGEQMKDILPSLCLAAVMGVCVLFMQYLPIPTIIVLLLQVFLGVLVYVGLSVLFRIDMFYYLLDVTKGIIPKR